MSTIIHILVFGLPLIVLPFGASHFEVPKVIIAELAILFLGVLYVQSSTNHKPQYSHYWPLIGLVALTALHIFVFPSASLFGNAFRLQGVYVFLHLLFFAYITSRVDTSKVNPLVPFATIFILALSTIWYGVNAAGRAYGLVGEPNAMAAMAVFCFPFILRLKGKFLNIFILSSAVLLAVILYTSGSRSALIAFGVELLFLWMILKKNMSFKLGLCIAAGIIGLSLFLPIFESNLFFENRLEIWYTALIASTHYPLFGWGVGGVEQGIAWAAQRLENAIRFQYVDSSHNFVLDWWVQGGIAGLALMGWLLYHVFRSFAKRHDVVSTAALLGLVTMLLFNPMSISVLVAFWWLVGRGYRND